MQELRAEIRQAAAVGDTARAQKLCSTLNYLISHPGISRRVANKPAEIIPRPRGPRSLPPAEESGATESAGSPDTANTPADDPHAQQRQPPDPVNTSVTGSP